MEQQKWQRLAPQIAAMFPLQHHDPGRVSPFVPRNIHDYMFHTNEMNNAQQRYLERKMNGGESKGNMTNQSYADSPESLPETITKINPAFNGKKFGVPNPWSKNPSNRGTVLAMETIWCPRPDVFWQPSAPWPCMAEMKWEGDSRVATEYGRFLRWHPIPRVPEHWAGHNCPGWNQDYKERSMVEILPFDQVWLIPTLEDILLPVDEIEDPQIIASLINNELLHEIENLDIF
jgi:hypothetical protein